MLAIPQGPSWPLTPAAPAAGLPPVAAHLHSSRPPRPHSTSQKALALLAPKLLPLSSLCREKMRREEGGQAKAEGASSPALSNLWELAPLITMTTGGGAAVSVAVAVTVRGQEIPSSDWLKGRMLPLPPSTGGQDPKP